MVYATMSSFHDSEGPTWGFLHSRLALSQLNSIGFSIIFNQDGLTQVGFSEF